MAARIIELADAVVADLKGQTFSMPVQVLRAYVPTVDLKDAKDLRLTVFPKQYEVQWASRSTAQTEYQLEVGVQKKLSADADLDVEFDLLMGLVQEVIDFLWEQARPAGLPDARINNVEHGTIYAAEHVTQLRQFTSVFTVTYRLTE